MLSTPDSVKTATWASFLFFRDFASAPAVVPDSLILSLVFSLISPPFCTPAVRSSSSLPPSLRHCSRRRRRQQTQQPDSRAKGKCNSRARKREGDKRSPLLSGSRSCSLLSHWSCVMSPAFLCTSRPCACLALPVGGRRNTRGEAKGGCKEGGRRGRSGLDRRRQGDERLRTKIETRRRVSSFTPT